jgi:hypothetical protein
MTKTSPINIRVRVASVTGRLGDHVDEARACSAAAAVLRDWQADAGNAYEAYLAAMDAGLDIYDKGFPRLARVWRWASNAADAAYVELWKDREGAYVEIVPDPRPRPAAADAADVRIASIAGRVGDEFDEERAIQAAMEVLRFHNMDANTAFKLYRDAFYRPVHEDFPPEAQVWLDAEEAANDAYNELWPDLEWTHVVIEPVNYVDWDAEEQ